MNAILSIIDSLLFAKPKEIFSHKLSDPTIYLIETNRQTYCGNIIFQDDKMIKFRTEEQKPVKILKSNIRQISILEHVYQKAL